LIEVRFQRGIHLPELDLWLDPWDARPRAFVSHAHADHFARHETVICSETTGLLLQRRFNLARSRLQTSDFHVPVVRDGFRLRLLAAGHIPGSAMLHITRIDDNESLLYTGDFKVRRSRAAEPVNFLAADSLIIETTFGLPCFEFPNQMEVEGEIIRFVQDAFADGVTPVLLAYSLGKAQEALALLAEHAVPVLLHPAAAAMTRACREAGVRGLPEPLEFDGHAPPGHALIAPPNSVRTKFLRGLKSKRTAMLTGWALQPGARFRYKVDSLIPLSDHADHPGLMECIQRVRPQRILTVHGYAHEFAAELRARQLDAWCASGGDQLELPIQRPPSGRKATTQRAPWQKRVVCPLSDFSDVCRLVRETGSRTLKAGFLSSYLAGLDDDMDLTHAVSWLAAVPPQKGTRPRVRRLDKQTLRHSLCALAGATDQRFRELHALHKDLVRSARVLLQELQLKTEPVDLSQAAAFIEDFVNDPDSMQRIRKLSARLGSLHPIESETLLMLIDGDLKTGIDEDLLQHAIHSAFPCGMDEIRAGWRITGSPVRTTLLAKHQRLDELKTMQTVDARDPVAPSPDHDPSELSLPLDPTPP
jgi:DNA ligase-1